MSTKCQPEVLVALSDPACLRGLSATLDRDGFDVTHAADRVDVEELLWAVQEEIVEPPDVIIADEAMVSRADLKTLRQLGDEGKSVFLLLLVATDESAERVAAMGFPYLYAPADVDDVRTVVRNRGFLGRAAEAGARSFTTRRAPGKAGARLDSIL